MNEDFKFKSPSVRRGYEYWRSKCKDGALASRSDLDPIEIPAILPHIILLDVEKNPRDFRYRLIGTLVCKHLLQDWTGTHMSEIEHQKPPSTIWLNCERVVDTRRPLKANTPYIGPYKEFLEAEDIILPLEGPDGSINMLFVLADYIRKENHIFARSEL
ncbi:MAG: hypothetical protein CMM59_11505 [Rhodospirillaceae bacterium]|nr:hypothetical protein [Rhodospirillaceae bacterium]